MDEKEPSSEKDPVSAPLGPRAAAGALDAGAIVVIATALVLVPWQLGGFALPMLGALAAIITWSVAPLAAYGATPSMQLLGLQVVGQDGRRPDALEMAFREMLGRGLLPASYVVVALIGIVRMLLGHGDIRATGRLGLALMSVSVLAATVAGLGHLWCLVRADRRGLADLLGGTRIVLASAAAPQGVEGEPGERAASQRRKRRIFLGFELSLAVFVVLGQLLLGQPWGGNASRQFADRKFRERAAMQFEANPGDSDLAADLIDRLEKAGDELAAQKVRERHRRAAASLERVRELRLRESIAKNPHDAESVEALVSQMEDEGRRDEAKAVVQAFVEVQSSPREQVRFGAWLQQRGFALDAARVLQQAIDGGETMAEAHAYLGLALRDLGRTEEARAALAAALAQVPDWGEVRLVVESLPPQAQARDAGR